MILRIESGKPMLMSVKEIFWCPWICPRVKKALAICVGYCIGAISMTAFEKT